MPGVEGVQSSPGKTYLSRRGSKQVHDPNHPWRSRAGNLFCLWNRIWGAPETPDIQFGL